MIFKGFAEGQKIAAKQTDIPFHPSLSHRERESGPVLWQRRGASGGPQAKLVSGRSFRLQNGRVTSPDLTRLSNNMRKPVPQPKTAPAMVRPHFPVWLMIAGFVGLMLLVYWPALRSSFVWDDDAYVTQNLLLRSTGGLGQIWSQLTATPQYYPLVHTSFWLEYHLWGLNPLGYHTVNVLLHTLASLLLWRVLVRLKVPGAWLAAGIFALHPVNVESVAWVTERKNVLSGVFYFAAALAYLHFAQETGGRRQETGAGSASTAAHPWMSRHYWLALFLFVCALLSKTVACSLPAALLLVLWWKKGRLVWQDWLPTIPFFGAGLTLGLVTSWLERTHVGAQGTEWAFGFPERCLIAGRAVWFYAAKVFWPANLTFIYPRWQINSAVWWQWLFPVAALAVVGLLWGLRRRIGRGPLVAVLFFGGTLFPALGFTNVYPMLFSFVADHFQYLAGVGLMVLAVAGLDKLQRPIPLAAVVLPLVLGVLTWKQAHIYADLETLWKDTLAKNPDCWLAHYNLGTYLDKKGQTDEMIRQFQEALRLKPDAESHYNLGTAFDKKAQTDEAVRQYQEAIRLQPDFAPAYNNLGYLWASRGENLDQARALIEKAVQLEPGNPGFLDSLGWVLFKLNRPREALDQLLKSAEIFGGSDSSLCDHLGDVYAALRQGDQAAAAWRQALALEPNREIQKKLDALGAP